MLSRRRAEAAACTAVVLSLFFVTIVLQYRIIPCFASAIIACPLLVKVAERLVAGPGNGWASRVFFTDNGSTATEVAIKMGFR